jgi:hypothetical protein
MVKAHPGNLFPQNPNIILTNFLSFSLPVVVRDCSKSVP